MGTPITKEEFEDVKFDPNRTIQELKYTTNEIGGGERHITILCTERMRVIASRTITARGTEYVLSA